MEHFPFIFTIFFMLLGPIKIIPAFDSLTKEADGRFKRVLAVYATAIAVALVLFVALVGGTLLDRYHISLNALRISGSLVLIIAALNAIFRRVQPALAKSGATPIQIAASPLAVPAIVPPAGVASILIFTMLAPEHPGMWMAICIALVIVMILDFLVMFFNDIVMKTPGLMLVLLVVGAAMVFMQVCIGVEIILRALTDLGLVVVRSSG
jgi:multiple antibiotic resistance protein